VNPSQTDGACRQYLVYGLRVSCELELTGCPLVPQTEAPDVLVRLHPHGSGGSLPPARLRWLEGSKTIARLDVGGVGRFEIRDGREVSIALVQDHDPSILLLSLVGPVMAVVLCQRGGFALHASAVSIAGEAVLFLGVSGSGKSTTAAALTAAGQRFLADDIVALVETGDGYEAMAGAGYVKIDETVRDALHLSGTSLGRMESWSGESLQLVGGELAVGRVPLGRVYVLRDGAALGMYRLAGHGAILELVRAGFGLRTFRGLIEPATYLAWCARLASRVPVVVLERPRAVTSLPALAAYVLRADGGK
jgi:hypothetical protein